MLGNKYTILTTTDGVNGRFENANPAYPFVNVTLDYQGNDVGLGITRTAARFDTLASTENEKRWLARWKRSTRRSRSRKR